ncbi:unnamed protein product [Mytilus coruscus]|uniref:Reverse transcriptase/retrotransposon-derived protein RNase H-like domain-containing protein n=1 Tax=Mytilus coruscus TaxID=42192 RepID=A0A6J8BU05_MYTCO|nr:unnamed protein product [Mytilus coruscus]
MPSDECSSGVVPPHLEKLYKEAANGRTNDEQNAIGSLLYTFSSAFSKSDTDLGLTHLTEHVIDTGNAKPVRQPPRKVPLAFINDEKNVVTQMLDQGIIQSTIVKDLTELTKKANKFVWTTDCQTALEKLKQAFVSADIMAFPRETGEFYLDTDASDFAIGAVLSQIQDGQMKVMAVGLKIKPKRTIS